MVLGSPDSLVRRIIPARPACNELRENGSDYIDGECENEIHSRIMDHLGLCNDCDGWPKSLAMTVGLMRGTPNVEVPESTMARIRAIFRSK